ALGHPGERRDDAERADQRDDRQAAPDREGDTAGRRRAGPGSVVVAVFGFGGRGARGVVHRGLRTGLTGGRMTSSAARVQARRGIAGYDAVTTRAVALHASRSARARAATAADAAPPGARRSRPIRADPRTGGAARRTTRAAGMTRAMPARSRSWNTASCVLNTPPARTTSGSRRTSAVRRGRPAAIVTTSSASRSMIDRATGSPAIA